MPFHPIDHLRMEPDGPVMVLTLDNPAMKNAFLDDMHEALPEVWPHLADDPAVRAVVLTGAGSAFCAGGDIPGFVRRVEDPEHRHRLLRSAEALLRNIAAFPKPLVVAVNGPAVGLGATLAVAGDIVYMAESAFLADTHVSVGLVAGDGGAAMWPLLMGLHRAKEYLLTGDRIPAEACVEFGLANAAVPDGELMERSMAMARRLADQPAQAVRDTKRAINLHLQHALQTVLPFALAAEAETFTTDDVRRAIESFQQR